MKALRALLLAGTVAVMLLAVWAADASAARTPLVGNDVRAVLETIRADVSCHDPCDDPFWLKAWVRGDHVEGLRVKFTVKGQTFAARCNSNGYAHYHLDINPQDYPQGEVVTVKASVRHDGVVLRASTWFKPNYN